MKKLSDYEHLIGKKVYAEYGSRELLGTLQQIDYEPSTCPFGVRTEHNSLYWCSSIEPVVTSLQAGEGVIIPEPKPNSRVTAWNDAGNKYTGTYIGKSFKGDYVVALGSSVVNVYKYIAPIPRKQITVADAEALILSLSGEEVEII